MTPGKLDPHRLLEAVSRAFADEAVSETAIATFLADLTGDVAAILAASAPGMTLEVRAVQARSAFRAERWDALLRSAVRTQFGAFAQTLLLGDVVVVSGVPWPLADSPAVQALLVPIRNRRCSQGVLILVREASDPPFSESEQHAFCAIASRAALEQTLANRDRAGDLARSQFDLFRVSLRLLGGDVDLDVALQPLAVQIRHTLGVASVAVLTRRGDDDRLEILAGAGLAADSGRFSVADARSPLIDVPLREGRVFFAANVAEHLPDALAPLRGALGAAGAVLALPLGGLPDILGVMLLAWPPGGGPEAESRAAALRIAELVSLLLRHARLVKAALEARAGANLAATVAHQRESLLRQIVHDLRNSVHMVGLAAEELDRVAAGAEHAQAAVGVLHRQGDFMASYLEDKIRSIDAEPLESLPPGTLEAAFRRLADIVAREVARQGRDLRLGEAGAVRLRLSQIQLDQILERLVLGAAERLRPAGVLDVRAALADGWVTITVDAAGTDSGAAEDGQGEARPDGLAIVEELVAAAGGQFGVRGSRTDACSFHVGLPTVDWGAST